MSDYLQVLSDVSRSQILDDLFNLGRAGVLPQVTALRATEYMTAERSYTPWYALGRNIAHVRRMLLKGSGSGLLQQYMQNLINDVFIDVGYADLDSDTHMQR